MILNQFIFSWFSSRYDRRTIQKAETKAVISFVRRSELTSSGGNLHSCGVPIRLSKGNCSTTLKISDKHWNRSEICMIVSHINSMPFSSDYLSDKSWGFSCTYGGSRELNIRMTKEAIGRSRQERTQTAYLHKKYSSAWSTRRRINGLIRQRWYVHESFRVSFWNKIYLPQDSSGVSFI